MTGQFLFPEPVVSVHAQVMKIFGGSALTEDIMWRESSCVAT